MPKLTPSCRGPTASRCPETDDKRRQQKTRGNRAILCAADQVRIGRAQRQSIQQRRNLCDAERHESEAERRISKPSHVRLHGIDHCEHRNGEQGKQRRRKQHGAKFLLQKEVAGNLHASSIGQDKRHSVNAGKNQSRADDHATAATN
jgi:hypothetical protein